MCACSLDGIMCNCEVLNEKSTIDLIDNNFNCNSSIGDGNNSGCSDITKRRISIISLEKPFTN